MCVQSQRPASAWVHDLVCCYAGDIRRKRLMAMLQGYVDDSGSDGLRIPYVLAGFILPAEKWEAFSDHWHSQLERSPRIEYFKMSEAYERNGQFLGIQPEIRDRKIRDLLEVIDCHKPIGICSYMRWSDFRNELEPHMDGQMKNPYHYLFPLIFDAIEKYQRKTGIFPEATDVDFDDQGSAGQFALETYPRVKLLSERETPEIARMMGRIPMMLNDKKVLPLQAADMLAWNIRRDQDINLKGDKLGWVFERLAPHIAFGLGYSVESFRMMLERKRQLDSQ